MEEAQALLERELDAGELMGAQFAPIDWAIEGVIPFGQLTIIGGKAKAARKSWVAGELALAVSEGGRWLGEFQAARPSPVIYVGSEDSFRRLASRARTMLGGRERSKEADQRLHYCTDWPTLEQGGLDRLRERVEQEGQPCLVILDVLSDFLRVGASYNRDRATIKALTGFAKETGTALVGIAHLIKGKISGTTDWTDRLQGSFGVAAALDVAIGIDAQLGANEGRLLITGKDVEGGAHKLTLDPQRMVWRATVEAVELAQPRVQLSPERELLLHVVEERPGRTAGQIHDLAPKGPHGQEWSSNTVRQNLFQMSKAGQLHNAGGRYFTPEQVAAGASDQVEMFRQPGAFRPQIVGAV